MTYELAKQLQDAGFPQVQPHSSANDFNDCTNPTLEELIEACGNNLFYFDKEYELYLQVSIGKWFAGYSDENDRVDNTPFATGSTPTEAVAHLWLSLHANNKSNK